MGIENNGLGRFTGSPENVSVGNRFFVKWYQRQDSFNALLDEAKYMLFMSSDDANEVTSRLSGGLFQDIASIYLVGNVARNNSEKTVILAGDVLSFFRDLYPNASVIRNPITTDSLRGASTPDGLIVDKSGIDKVCEYTLNENKWYFKNKYLNFKAQKRNFPELFAHSNLLFVLPSTVHPVMGEIKAAIGDRAVQFLELPFSRTEFRKFVEKVCAGHGMNVGEEKEAV